VSVHQDWDGEWKSTHPTHPLVDKALMCSLSYCSTGSLIPYLNANESAGGIMYYCVDFAMQTGTKNVFFIKHFYNNWNWTIKLVHNSNNYINLCRCFMLLCFKIYYVTNPVMPLRCDVHNDNIKPNAKVYFAFMSPSMNQA